MLDGSPPPASSPVKLAERLAVQLARTIARRRSALGLSQAELAERLDLAPKTISGLERAKHLPSLVTVVRLAEVLQVSVSELLGERR
jgi:transcriptional regulator with XRE-family HTH domain